MIRSIFGPHAPNYVTPGWAEAMRARVEDGFIDVNEHNGVPLLSFAAVSGNVVLVKLLLARGARLDVLCSNGWTALHNAAIFNHMEVARILITAGCNIDAFGVCGYTPLFGAVQFNRHDIARMLIDAGANVTLLPRINEHFSDPSFAVISNDLVQLVAESRPRQAVTLLNWLLAMAPLQLPIYIYLELADRSIVCPVLKEIEKIKMIQGVMDSYRRVERVRVVVPRRSNRLAKRNKL